MNHHYRIVWSQVLDAWVAVSEISKGKGKAKSVSESVVDVLASIGLLVFPITSSALDLPSGAKVTAGAATLQTTPNVGLQINQSTPRAVIRWSDFSVGQGKQVTFSQPNAGAATLNVVTGHNSSVIAGTLKANGAVYLINQNGIAITPTGLVDTRAGFIASTLRIDENAFMEGKNVFSGKGGSVVNRGQILTGSGGTVGLLGSTVANEGLISVPLGKVVLASGEAATLDLSGDGFLQLIAPSRALAGDGQALVSNSGVIQATGGLVMLTAATVRQALREAVNMSGNISARSVSGQNGAIVLEGGAGGNVRVSGSLAADGETTGGRIDVTGASVALEGATLSATGSERGGLVRVGGAFQGGREQTAGSADAMLFAGRFGSVPVIANATTTTVDAASTINVSATGSAGTGGTAIVWSDSTTVMQGAIRARGAAIGGAVEVSAKSTIQSINLKRIDLGRGGTLLLDPQDIVIDRTGTDTAANTSYATPETITHLSEADITALLSTGANVSLQASQDISWLDNFSFVKRTQTTPGGNLNLTAGRSVKLSGIFQTADGNWTIVANDTAAHGVVDAKRGTGAAEIDLRNANFINSNGNLSLTLADGAGNTHHEADRITLGRFNGNGLTATIASTATPAYGATRILITDDINVSGAISLTGDLQFSPMSPLLSLSGQKVTWTNEKTGGTISGEGAIKFVENGVTTRFGQLRSGNAQRVGLGDIPSNGLTRTYGDNDLSIAAILPSGAVLSADSLQVTGPGVHAAAGDNHMTLSATNRLAFADGLNSGYFVDLTPATLPLTITQRSVTPTVSAGVYTYGSPTAVVSLAGVVNGDVLKPVARLNSAVGITMVNNGAGFGFAETVSAGSSGFSLTGLSGAQASNYTLNINSVTGSTLNISQKALTYIAGSGRQTYGSLGTMPSASLSGIVAGDDVVPVVALNASGQTVSLYDRLPAGTYASEVVSITGSMAGNYAVAATGNTSGQYVIAPKSVSVTYNSSPVFSTYGTQSTLEAPTLNGILSGDTVTGTFGALSSGAPVTLTPTTPAGNYSAVVTGLSGASSSNYVVTGGNGYGTLAISKKALTYTGSNSSQVYGSLSLPSPPLNGIIGSDSVSAVQQITEQPFNLWLGGSGAYQVGKYRVDLGTLTGTSAANYTLAESGNTPNQVVITAKPVTFSVASATSTYGTNAVLPTATLSGVVSGDNVNAGPLIFIGSGAVPINANTAVGHFTFGIDRLTGDSVANNYILASTGNTTGALAIAPKTLTWAVANDTVTYGNALTNATTLNGLVGGDRVFSSISAFDGNGAALARPTVGTYGVGVTSLTGPLASNYALAASGNTMGSVNIGPRPLTYTISPSNSVYGTLAQDGAVVLGNVLPGDSVGTAILGYQAASTSVVLTERSPVGSYTSQVTALTGANPNYVVSSTGNTNGVLTIAPKPVTSSIPNASSTYGTAAVLEAGVLSGVLAGDVVLPGATTLSTGLLPLERQAAGSYALITSSLSGPQAGNYAIAATGSTSGKLNIAPKPLTYSMEAYWWDQHLADTVTYGEVHRIANFYTGFETRGTRLCLASCVVTHYTGGGVSTLSGVLAGDDVSLQVNSPTLPVSTSGAYTVGTYRWTGGALSSPNYVLAATGNTDKTLTILPRALPVQTVGNANNVSSQNSVEYGSTAGAVPGVNVEMDFMFNLKGRFPLRNVDQVSADAEYVTPQGNVERLAERQAVGEYQVVMKGGLTGADAGNYIATTSFYQQGFSVTPKKVTAKFFDTTSHYGDQPQDPSPVLSGVLPGDSFGIKLTINGDADFVLHPRTPVYDPRYAVGIAGKTGVDAGNYWVDAGQTEFAKYYFPNQIYGGKVYGTLKILPKELTVVGGSPQYTLTYGDVITANHMSLAGVVPGDNIQITPKAQSWDTTQPKRDINGARLNAGTYNIFAEMSENGSSNSNYTLANQGSGFGRIDVAKRGTKLEDVTIVYGDKLNRWIGDWVPSFANVLVGDDLSSTPIEFLNKITRKSEPLPTGLLDAGEYHLGIKQDISRNSGDTYHLSGPGSGNYYLLAGGAGSKFTVSPKILTWAPNSNLTTTFGDPVNLGRLSGFVDSLWREFSDNSDMTLTSFQVNAKIEDSKNVSGAAGDYSAIISSKHDSNFNSSAIDVFYTGYNRRSVDNGFIRYKRYEPIPASLNELDTRVDRPLNAGSQNLFTVGAKPTLSGERAGNYLLPENMQVTVEIKPRTVTWSIANTTRQYGNYEGCDRYGCPFNITGTTLGKVTYVNMVPSDILMNNTFNSGFKNIGLIAANGEKGTAANLLTSRTPVGATFEQVLDSIGNKNYVLASNGNSNGLLKIEPKRLAHSTTSGFFIKGIGMVGEPGKTTLRGIEHDQDVTPIIELTSNFGLINYGGNNVNPSSLGAGRYEFLVKGLAGVDAANYLLADNSSWWTVNSIYDPHNTIGTLDIFNDTSLGMRLMPVIPFTLAPPLSPPSATNSAVADKSASMRSTNASANSSRYSAGAQAIAITTSTGAVAGVEFIASADAEATAECSGIGCKAKVTAGVEVEHELSDSEKLAAEARASAEARAGLSRTGFKLAGTATAKAGVGVEGERTLDGAGDLSYGGSIDAVAGAQATATAGYKDGKVGFTTGGQVGAGFTASTNVGLAGDVGSVSASPSISSPGSFGGQFKFEPGYSDGVLSVSMNLGAQIGLGGLNLNIDLSLNLGAVADFFDTNKKPRREKSRDIAESLSSDPLGQIAYLKSTDDWRGQWDVKGPYQAKIDKYDALVNEIPKALQASADLQNRILTLMATDPAAAVELVRSGTKLNGMTNRYDAIGESIFDRVDSLGLELGIGVINNDGKMSLSNINK